MIPVEPKDIAWLRNQLGWTQAELARELGTDAVTVSRWERGVSAPRPAARKRLSRLLVTAGPRSQIDFVEDPTTRVRKIESALRQMKALKRSVKLRS
jgi:transcriptional regulator with XRE-family HTH domain